MINFVNENSCIMYSANQNLCFCKESCRTTKRLRKAARARRAETRRRKQAHKVAQPAQSARCTSRAWTKLKKFCKRTGPGGSFKCASCQQGVLKQVCNAYTRARKGHGIIYVIKQCAGKKGLCYLQYFNICIHLNCLDRLQGLASLQRLDPLQRLAPLQRLHPLQRLGLLQRLNGLLVPLLSF